MAKLGILFLEDKRKVFVLFCIGLILIWGWGFLPTADIWHTEAQLEEMLLLAANGLELTAHWEALTQKQSRTLVQD